MSYVWHDIASRRCPRASSPAGVTTRGIADRAGVSIGALQHHFRNKSELVAAAVEHLNAELMRELVAQAPAGTSSERELAEELVDVLWAIHKGPLIAAMSELWVAARTDGELRARLVAVQRDVQAASTAIAAYLFPQATADASPGPVMDTALAAMRGLAVLRFVDPPAAEAMWPATRRHLLALAFDTSAAQGEGA